MLLKNNQRAKPIIICFPLIKSLNIFFCEFQGWKRGLRVHGNIFCSTLTKKCKTHHEIAPLKRAVHGHEHALRDSSQNKSYGPTLNSKKSSTANLKESVFKFAHPLLYVSKVKSAISKCTRECCINSLWR